jgi:hypothetical protein
MNCVTPPQDNRDSLEGYAKGQHHLDVVSKAIKPILNTADPAGTVLFPLYQPTPPSNQ